MRLFGLEIKKSAPLTTNSNSKTEIVDAELELIKEYKRQKKQMDLALIRAEMSLKMEEMKLRHEELRIERESLRRENGIDDTDDLFKTFISKFLEPKLMQPQQQTMPSWDAPQQQMQQINIQSNLKSLSTEELKKLWDSQPSYIKEIAKNYNDQELFDYIGNKYPEYDDDTIERAVDVVRGRVKI